MAVVLCIETATTNCSVALSVNGSVIAFREDSDKNYSHAEQLHVFIEEILAEVKLDKANLDAIAVSKGPGSYTGLRIGVSAVKGLCYALEIPLISIPTLAVLASQVNSAATVVPMLDARRMEVYAAVYAEEKEIRKTRAEILNETSFAEYLQAGKVVFIGNGVEKFKTLCQHPNAEFITDALPSAKQMAVLAEKKYTDKLFEDVAYFEPYYLKDFKMG
ncbi:tRNA (adenosine(37)-N6)-threonylcarbamoyltransferase complex dimerization subunit type 1 TsaB [Rasiella sp. SM2506]|uniref:tRNA (adenosine(37)-N6)-threonylcarbamoyltransferase complex dimerization subunit type 1 TsaB n=1 Tax=Rasiella sp. SM2506 TaxID=3423914 RepID=UPI003D7909A5